MPILTLADLVAAVESGNNQFAIRYEPNFVPSALAVKRCQNSQNGFCSVATAKIICASSWGKYQIMGENIYGLLNLSFSIGKFLSDPDSQREIFDSFLTKKNINFSLAEILSDQAKRDSFSIKYNGSLQYGQRLLGVYHAASNSL